VTARGLGTAGTRDQPAPPFALRAEPGDGGRWGGPVLDGQTAGPWSGSARLAHRLKAASGPIPGAKRYFTSFGAVVPTSLRRSADALLHDLDRPAQRVSGVVTDFQQVGDLVARRDGAARTWKDLRRAEGERLAVALDGASLRPQGPPVRGPAWHPTVATGWLLERLHSPAASLAELVGLLLLLLDLACGRRRRRFQRHGG